MRRWLIVPRAYLALGAIVLLVRIATALPIQHAGYMDASYTIHIAENLARGLGFSEQVLWNYLDTPTSLPHPSNLYWMPLPALLAAASFVVLGISYHAAQVPFILLSVIPPLFAFYLGRRVFGRDDYAWTAGLLTAFSGFYTIYWIAPDNFAPFAVTADSCPADHGVRPRAQTTHLGTLVCSRGICRLESALPRRWILAARGCSRRTPPVQEFISRHHPQHTDCCTWLYHHPNTVAHAQLCGRGQLVRAWRNPHSLFNRL